MIYVDTLKREAPVSSPPHRKLCCNINLEKAWRRAGVTRSSIFRIGGTGSEVMRRIAAPMVGGMVSAAILTLIVIPAVFLIWKTIQIKTL